MKRLLLVLAACAEPPGREVYECTGSLVCEGVEYPLQAQRACLPDLPTAEVLWARAVAPLLEQTGCLEHLECYPTSIPCLETP